MVAPMLALMLPPIPGLLGIGLLGSGLLGIGLLGGGLLGSGLLGSGLLGRVLRSELGIGSELVGLSSGVVACRCLLHTWLCARLERAEKASMEMSGPSLILRLQRSLLFVPRFDHRIPASDLPPRPHPIIFWPPGAGNAIGPVKG
eukprot:1365267-Amorphochlora_amoeboformis.AAC.1